MPEAIAIRFETSADVIGPACLLGKDRHRCGPETTLNNGRGRVVDAHASGAAETADGITVGTCSGRLAFSTAEGGPADLTGLPVRTGGARGPR